MARKPKAMVAAPVESRDSTRKVNGVSVEFRPYHAARALQTIEIGSGELALTGLESRIVRLRPVPGTSQEVIDSAVAMVRTANAAGVKVVMPAAVPSALIPVSGGARVPRMGPRTVVERMVEDAVGVDKAALSTLVQGILATEGL